MKKLSIILILALILIQSVSAFGVTAFYYKEKPLILNPGDIKDVQLLLQNEKNGQPTTIKAEIASGNDIAVLTGRTFFDLNPGDNGIPVDLKITIPQNSNIGDKYEVGVTFTTASKPGKDEMLSLGTQISKSIPIVVGRIIQEEPVPIKQAPKIPYGIIAIVLIIALLIVLMKRLPKAKKK